MTLDTLEIKNYHITKVLNSGRSKDRGCVVIINVAENCGQFKLNYGFCNRKHYYVAAQFKIGDLYS